jgi:hypothetical protein
VIVVGTHADKLGAGADNAFDVLRRTVLYRYEQLINATCIVSLKTSVGMDNLRLMVRTNDFDV